AVLVDFPGLHFRLAEQLRLRKIPVIQYVSPKLWAWGASRMARLAEDFDLVLGILPFEEEFFRATGVNYRFVGCPQKDRVQKVIVDKASLGFDPARRLVALLPGSRATEFQAITPRLLKIK